MVRMEGAEHAQLRQALRTHPLLLHRPDARHDDRSFAQAQYFADGVVSGHGNDQVGRVDTAHHVVVEFLDHQPRMGRGEADAAPILLGHFRPADQQRLDVRPPGDMTESVYIVGQQLVAIFATAAGHQHQMFVVVNSKFSPDLVARLGSTIAP